MTRGNVTIRRGDARHLPLADNSVDLVVTSPPFLNLRSYTDGGSHYDGQIGAGTRDQFLQDLWDATAEMARVLKPTGSIWVELGDSYTNKSLNMSPHRYAIGCTDKLGLILRAEVIWDRPNGLPESVTDRVRRSHSVWFHLVKQPRYYSAIDRIRSLAPNAPRGTHLAAPRLPALGPELCATLHTDDGPAVARGWCQLGSLQQGIRAAVTRQTEGFQILQPVGFVMRVKTTERDYVVDLKPVSGSTFDATMAVAVQDALAKLWPAGAAPTVMPALPFGVVSPGVVPDHALRGAKVLGLECVPIATEGLAARVTLDLDPGRATLLVWDSFAAHRLSLSQRCDPLGALPGSVWEIATEPLQVPAHLGIDHFAAFPMEWPRRIILGWSPAGICTTCGEGRRPVTDKTNRPLQATYNGTLSRVPGKNRQDCRKGVPQISEVTITGEVCGCPDTSAPTRPAVVLDPFAGTGTTLLVAKALGRDAVGVDMSADYCRLAEWRTQDPGQIAKAMGVPKPPKELDGQASALDLLTELDGGAA